MGRLFGTDGGRGAAKQELTAELALALGAAAARRAARHQPLIPFIINTKKP